MPATAKPGRPPATRKTTQPQSGDTAVQQDGESKPRLPHEHDQSADSQSGNANPQTVKVGRQAQRDVARGLVDTDRGPPADQAYKKQKR